MAPASPVRHGRQTAADGPLCSAAANHALIPGGRSCGYAFGTSQSSPVSPRLMRFTAVPRKMAWKTRYVRLFSPLCGYRATAASQAFSANPVVPVAAAVLQKKKKGRRKH